MQKERNAGTRIVTKYRNEHEIVRRGDARLTCIIMISSCFPRALVQVECFSTHAQTFENHTQVIIILCIEMYMPTYHLTLAQSAISIPISANIWIFPAVKNASIMKTKKRNANAPSTMCRNVGCKEEPGLRIFETNESSGDESSVISVI